MLLVPWIQRVNGNETKANAVSYLDSHTVSEAVVGHFCDTFSLFGASQELGLRGDKIG